MKYLFVTILSLSFLFSYSQNNPKQSNTPGAEIYPDIPHRIEKFDSEGNLNPIPVHVFVHHASGFGSNYELMNISIKVKNTTSNTFEDLIIFDDLTPEELDELIINKSTENSILNIQDFDASLPIVSSNYTIDFTSHSHTVIPTTYVDITSDYWWFTINIPGDKFDGYEDVIDFEVFLELDWDPDEEFYFRVFRPTTEYPKLQNWYRGDPHYHALFTQNSAELGLPMGATKIAAKNCGLEWITVTDHSCDYDNYGNDLNENWEILGNMVSELNQEDSSFIFVRGIEMTIKNSQNKHVHALTYPSPSAPLSMPYFGDGDGDLIGTDVTVDNLTDSVIMYDAFFYAAHPFAEGDVLSAMINGSVWNLGDDGFPENEEELPSGGEVICNNTSEASDVYANGDNTFIKNGFKGGQIWNLYNPLVIDANENNPWNVMNDNDDEFYVLDANNSSHHKVRFRHNLDVSLHIWKEGLSRINSNPEIQNWKYFILAGSDAHGSFNYSNTDYSFSIIGAVTNNAMGKISTLAYCPNGMGENGSNILSALKSGHTILSSGPIIGMEIDIDLQNDIPEIIIGDDAVIGLNQLENAILRIPSGSSAEFGNVDHKRIIVTTEDNDYYYNLPLDTYTWELSLNELLENVFGENNIPLEEYFIIRTEMSCIKEYDQPSIYKQDEAPFYSYSNPIWLKITDDTFSELNKIDNISIYPNPSNGNVYIESDNGNQIQLSLYDIKGNIIYNSKLENLIVLSSENIAAGIYFARIQIKDTIVSRKIVFTK